MSEPSKTAPNRLKVYNGFDRVSLAKLSRSISGVLMPEPFKNQLLFGVGSPPQPPHPHHRNGIWQQTRYRQTQSLNRGNALAYSASVEPLRVAAPAT